MKKHLYLIALLCLVACGKTDIKDPGTGPSGELVITPYNLLNSGDDEINSHAGQTARSCLTFVGGSFNWVGSDATNLEMVIYPRFIKTSDGRYLMFYQNGSYNASTGKNAWSGTTCHFVESTDLKNWKYVKNIFSPDKNAMSQDDGGRFTRTYSGAHPVRLSNGNILVVSSYAHSGSDFRFKLKDNGLAIKISEDEGKTWGRETRINVGTNWEPRPLVLSTGRVVIYYTDSCPYILAKDSHWPSDVVSSGVSYIYSDDNGVTWKPDDPLNNHLWAYRQFRDEANGWKCYTDQMPGVIQVNGTTQLVGVGEANMAKGSSSTTDYWVSISYSDPGKAFDWGTPDALNVLPSDRVNKFTKGAGPQIEQFASGETVLTYNTNNIFYYRLGDEKAREFTEEYAMFPGSSPINHGFWGSTYPDGHVLVAGVGGAGGSNGKNFKMQVGQFYLNHNINASSREVVLDGDNREWKTTDQALFVGSKSDMHATLRASLSGDRLCFLAELDAAATAPTDKITVFLASAQNTELAKGDCRMSVSTDGSSSCGVYPGWQVSALGQESAVAKGDNCWIAEFSIPLSALPVKGDEVLVNFAVSDAADGTQSIRPIPEFGRTGTSDWMKIILK